MMNNAPKLRFPEFEGEWEEEALDQLGSFKKGSILGRQDLSSEGTPCILYGELYTKYGEITTSVESRTEKDYCGFLRSEYGDILIPASGETADDISTSTCLLLNDVIIGGDINLYRSKKVDGRYLSYLLNHKKKNEIARLAQGASVVHIYSAQLKNVKIPKPSAAEQTKIADFLTLVDKKITKQDEKVVALEQHKKGLMQKIFSREIRFKDESGKDYPEWEELLLGDVCDVITTGKLDANAMKHNGKYRFYTCAKNYYYIDEYAFDDEALLISGNGANVGYIHYFSGKFNAYQRTYVLMGFSVNVLFLKAILEMYLSNRIRAEVNAGNTPYIRMSTLSEMSVVIPIAPEEQTKIANFLSLYDRKNEKEKAKLEALRAQKKGLLQQMFV